MLHVGGVKIQCKKERNNSAEKFRQLLFFESTKKKETRKTEQNAIQNQILIKSIQIFRFGIEKLTAKLALKYLQIAMHQV